MDKLKILGKRKRQEPKEETKQGDSKPITKQANQQQFNGITIELNKKEIGENPLHTSKSNISSILESHQIMSDYEGRKILKATEKPSTFQPFLKNGFVSAVLSAFNEHYNLTLRPDDIWIAITTQFAIYVEKHADKLRDKFVNHQGQKELVVIRSGTMKTADWNDIVDEFSVKIDMCLQKRMKDWITSDFSTSTKVDVIVSQLVLMGAMQHYFKYTALFKCGIPSVTLLGNLDDWVKIKDKVQKLSEFGLKEWSKTLTFILDKFIETVKGNGDKEFWNQICNYFYRGGSGAGQFINGWILAFVPFDKDGDYQLPDFNEIKEDGFEFSLREEKITSSTISFPMKVIDNITEYKLLFYAGMMQNIWEEDSKSVRPSVDYALIDVTNSKVKKSKKK